MQRERISLVRGYLSGGMKWGCMRLFEARDGRGESSRMLLQL